MRDGRVVARRRRIACRLKERPTGRSPKRWTGSTLSLRNSVEVHQRSDVPYGMFLSGGVDSSTLLALMAELNDKPVHAFTAGFLGASVGDERAHARAVADAVGAHTVDIAIGPEDFWRDLPRIAGAMDDPTADYAVLPTFLLAEAVRREGLKVVLTGEGEMSSLPATAAIAARPGPGGVAGVGCARAASSTVWECFVKLPPAGATALPRWNKPSIPAV